MYSEQRKIMASPLTAVILCFLLRVGLVQSQDVRRPPTITKGPTEKGQVQLYRSGARNVRIPCEGSGTPPPTFQWFKNGKKVDFNTQPYMKQMSGGAILITMTSFLDEGYYQCVAQNMYGTAMSDVLLFQRAFLETHSSESPVTKTVTEGDSLTIPCNPVPSSPYPSFSWSLVVSKTDKTPKLLKMNERISIDAKGNLHFAYVMPEDAQNGKLYKCNVFNYWMDLTTGGSYASINVNTSPNVGNKKPSILYSPDTSLVAVEGGTLKMKCFFKGRPTPTVDWEKVDGHFPVDRYSYKSHGQELDIDKVQPEDAGIYTCRANNSAGASDSYDIKVKIEVRPKFLTPPGNKNISEGTSVTFDCNTTATPKAEITWYRNGQKLHPTRLPERWALSEENTKLTITGLRKKDPNNALGDLTNVQCNASNIHGYVFADSYVNVLMPLIIVEPPMSYTLNETSPKLIVLNCSATADDSTPVTIEWRRNDELITCDDSMTQTMEGHLEINITDGTDTRALAGNYTCIATNGYHTSTASAYIIIQLPIDDVVVAGICWICVVLAIIMIIAFIIIIILVCCCCCLYCRRRRSGKYAVDKLEHKGGNDPEKELSDLGYKDYHRPEEPLMKGSRASLGSSLPLTDSASSAGSPGDLGDISLGDFQEDGSFNGQYTEREKPPPYTPRA